jgi:hypothetical protein
MPAHARRLPLVAVLALTSALLLAPAAPAAPASAPAQATVAKKKACKKRKGETRKHWLKRCRCTKFKAGETRSKFRKRCPGAKVPKRKAAAPVTPPPAGGGAPPATPPAGQQALTGQPAIDYVATAMKGMRISRVSCTPASTGGCSSSITENVDFCQDGATFQGRKTNESLSGVVYEVNFAGTYRVLEAGVNAERTGAQAKVESTITQATGNDDPPPSGQGILTFVGANQVFLGTTEYTRGQGAC